MLPDSEYKATLATSIAPRNIDNQQRAVASWLELGFSVASLNTAPEIDQLRPLFANVEFVPVTRDARVDCGHPLIYLDDVIAYLRNVGTPTVGIINSDIHLRASRRTARLVIEMAAKSLVIGCRTDLDEPGSTLGQVYVKGFDVFLFDKAALAGLPPSRFCLGQPWWDYWFPLSLTRANPDITAKFLAFPFAYHVKHAVNWEQNFGYEKYGLHFLEFFTGREEHEKLQRLSLTELKRSLISVAHDVQARVFLESQWISYRAFDKDDEPPEVRPAGEG